MNSPIQSSQFEGLWPGRLWSLWDMHRVFIQTYLKLGMNLQAVSAIFGMVESDSHAGGKSTLALLSPRQKIIEELTDSEKGGLTDTLGQLHDLCQELGLSVSRRMLKRALVTLPETRREFEIHRETVLSEMKDSVCLAVPRHLGQYYEWDGIVSDKVIDAFPKSYEEIRSAGNCLAAGLDTACVFHAMRAAEIGLRSLAAKHNLTTFKNGKPLELAEWREILDGLAGVARDLENVPHTKPSRDADILFFSEACAQFRFFKNGWRIRVAHARATYDEPQAKETIDHVRSFFETLATQLKE